jgi:hypothetical protein
MVSQVGGEFRLSVLNPGGLDPEQDFAHDESGAHAPVNFHAYAAATRGSFLRETARAVVLGDPVLLLLRGNFRAAEEALLTLKEADIPVAVSLKETGLHQIAVQLGDPARLRSFQRIVQAADGCIGPTPEATELYRSVQTDVGSVAFVATPYPTHDARWNFSIPVEERRGLLIGTHEWDVPSRNHAAALFAARRISDATGEPVSIFNEDRRKGRRLIEEIGLPADRIEIIDWIKSYPEYLRTVARHKITFQLDTSFVPGQVAGDALLCRLPCIGGNGAIDRTAFPEICGTNRSIGQLVEFAIALLRDEALSGAAVDKSQERAAEYLSFGGAATRLRDFFAKIQGRGSMASK